MIPSGIPKDFAESWDAFREVFPADGILRDEAFRLLVKQAGGRTKTKYKASKFCKLKPHFEKLLKQFFLMYLLYHLIPQRHSYKIELNEDKLLNVTKGFSIVGQMVLKPQRFTLTYLLDRMINLKVFSKDAFPWEARAAHAVKDRDFILLKGTSDFELRLAKTSNVLVLRYKVFCKDTVPLYRDLNKQLLAEWRQLTMGEFK